MEQRPMTRKERRQRNERLAVERQAKTWLIINHFIEYCIKFKCFHVLGYREWQWMKYQVVMGQWSEERLMKAARSLRKKAKLLELKEN